MKTHFKWLEKIVLIGVLICPFSLIAEDSKPTDFNITQRILSGLPLPKNSKEAYVCDEINQANKPLKFCYLSPNKFNEIQGPLSNKKFKEKNLKFLLVLHGAGANDVSAMFPKFYGGTEMILEKGGKAPIPLFITFGPAWVLSRHPDFFSVKDLVMTTLPAIAQKIEQNEQIVLDSKFSIMGGSMGGHNTLQIFLNFPEKIYSAVAFCAAVLKLAPGSTPAQIQKYIQVTGAKPELAKAITTIARSSYADDRHFWRDNLYTIWTQKSKDPKIVFPKLWLDYETGDEFGFGLTNSELAAGMLPNLTQMNVNKVPGGHCTSFGKLFPQLYQFVSE